MVTVVTAAVLSLLIRLFAPSAIDESPRMVGMTVWASAATVGFLAALRSPKEVQ